MNRALTTVLCAGIALLSGCGGGTPSTGILDFNPPEAVMERLRSERKSAMLTEQYEGRPSLTLLQFSDLHGDAENLSRIVEFYDACSECIDDVIHLGDVVPCYWDEPNPWNTVPGAERFLNTVGNHDCWKGHLVWSQTNRPYDASQEDAYALVMKDFIASWNVVQPQGVNDPESPHWRACYYYRDYADAAVRLIVLDCMHYGSVQDKWFSEALQDAAAKGLTVVAAQHYPPQPGLDKIESGFSDLDQEVPASPDPGDLQLESMADAAYASVDRFIASGGTFACWLGGHIHSDMLGHVKGHLRQLHIAVDKAGEGDQYMQEDRTRGTANQDSFNLVTINTSRGALFVDRIGCCTDQYMRPKTLFCYRYTDGQIITNK